MQLQYFQYKLPFTEPFRTASNTFNFREGIIIRLKKDGLTALGEASPLPGFSNESLQDVIHQLRNHQGEIENYFAHPFSLKGTRKFLDSFKQIPSLQFGLFTLAATYLAQQKTTSLRQLLFQTPSDSIAINAVIGTGSQRRIEKVDEAVNKGYQTIKLKVDDNFSEFYHFLETVRSKHPNLTIRIDANQSWTFEQATNYLAELEDYSIKYCEEPLAEPDSKSIKALNEKSPIPIALDESINQTFSISESFELAPIIISKPMIYGLQVFNNETMRLAKKYDTKLIFTTSLESSIGRLMTASLAAGMGSTDFAHGLDTGRMLSIDIWRDEQFIRDGRFHLPDANDLEQLMNTDLLSLGLQKVNV